MDHRKVESCKLVVENGALKESSEIHGGVQFPVWDFIKVDHFLNPVLHGEIGLVKMMCWTLSMALMMITLR